MTGLALFDHSISSLLKGDLRGSNDNIEDIEKLEVLCREINTLALKHKGAVAISVGYIVESLRRLGDYAKNISENAINHMVGYKK
jgi:phosphate uptake regulator